MAIGLHLDIPDILRLAATSQKGRRILMGMAFIRLYTNTRNINCHQLRLCWQNVYCSHLIEQVVDQCVNKHWAGLMHNRGFVRMVYYDSDDFILLSSPQSESSEHRQLPMFKVKIVPVEDMNTGFYVRIDNEHTAYSLEKLREVITQLLFSQSHIRLVDVVSLGEDMTYILPTSTN